MAFFLMVLDHIPRALPVKWGIGPLMMGRGAMPLFCLTLGFGLAQAASPSIAVATTLRRLLVAGILSQPLYVWAFHNQWRDLNVLFTLFSGVLLVRAFCTPVTVRSLLVTATALPVLYFSDYGVCGAVLVMAFFLIGQRRFLPYSAALAVLCLLGLRPELWVYIGLAFLPVWAAIAYFAPIQVPRIRHVFYYAYPAHLLGLAAVRAYMASH